MKYIKLLFLLIGLILLSACSIDDGSIQEKIEAPKNIKPPIEGKWVIRDYIDDEQKDLNLEKIESFIGVEGLFHKDAIVLGENFSLEPAFKLKKVKAYDYLLYKYKKDPSSLGIKNTYVNIITVSNQKQLMYEFIRLDNDTILLYMENVFFVLEKVVDEVSLEEINRYINVEETMTRSVNSTDTNKTGSGVLLGIKVPTYDANKDIPNWEYKTFWINKIEDIVNVYELEGLLVPRKNGFYNLDIKREKNGEFSRDYISLTPYSDNLEENTSRQLSSRETPKRDKTSILKNILFVGNDYISIENIEIDNKNKRTLKMYALDNVKNDSAIKLSDILGEEGEEFFLKEAKNIKSLDENSKIDETNVGLIRRDGYWIINGRVNYIQNEEELYKDFNIKAIPPKEIVSFDEQFVPWNKLEMRVSGISDAFSSPNEDFIIIVREGRLEIYDIEEDSIKLDKPLKKISLPSNSSVVMSEWALGKYTDIWEDIVIGNNGKLVNEE